MKNVSAACVDCRPRSGAIQMNRFPVNLRKTCFLPTIRALFSLPPFENWLHTHNQPFHTPMSITNQIFASSKWILTLELDAPNVQVPEIGRNQLQELSSRYSAHSQDAYQFLSCLLKSMERETKLSHTFDESLESIFAGCFCVSSKCSICKNSITAEKPFESIELSPTLRSFECDHYFAANSIKFCKTCRREVEAEIKTSFTEFPKILCIRSKPTTPINTRFTKELNLNKYCDFKTNEGQYELVSVIIQSNDNLYKVLFDDNGVSASDVCSYTAFYKKLQDSDADDSIATNYGCPIATLPPPIYDPHSPDSSVDVSNATASPNTHVTVNTIDGIASPQQRSISMEIDGFSISTSSIPVSAPKQVRRIDEEDDCQCSPEKMTCTCTSRNRKKRKLVHSPYEILYIFPTMSENHLLRIIIEYGGNIKKIVMYPNAYSNHPFTEKVVKSIGIHCTLDSLVLYELKLEELPNKRISEMWCQNMNSLKEIAIKSDTCVTPLLQAIAANCNHLQKLEIPLGNGTFRTAASSIKSLHKLTQLKLNCNKRKITPLLDQLRSLKSLKVLELCDALEHQNFVKKISEMTQLRVFRLINYNCASLEDFDHLCKDPTTFKFSFLSISSLLCTVECERQQ